MRRRTRLPLLASLVAIAAVGVMAGTVLAKEGAAVSLAQPIPRDAEPGTTISVTFTVTVETATGSSPVYGSPVFVRLIAPDGTSTEGSGREHVSGSGTYTADVVVPAGGIKSAEFGLRGSSQDANGKYVRSDEMFEVHGWLFTTTGVTTGVATGSAPATGSSGAAGVDIRLAILVGLITLSAAAFGIGIGLGRRRRRLAPTA
jgi:hypothetical protein